MERSLALINSGLDYMVPCGYVRIIGNFVNQWHKCIGNSKRRGNPINVDEWDTTPKAKG